jgi:tetratricopeptide (TPR) repeat protein
MRTPRFLTLPFLLALASGSAQAQTNSPSAAPPPRPRPHIIDVPQPVQPSATATADNLDPARIAEYQKRFEAGYALEQQGKLAEARAIYDGILAEQPKARRSLLEAGRISYKLGELARADEYLERLHELEPDFPEAIELLIQINQALKRDVKVELLVRDFDDLHAGGKIPDLSRSLCFVRERVHLGQQDIVISQFFDYTQDPNTVWMAEVFDPGGELKRRLLLNYDADMTRALRARDARYATTQVFTWFEHIMKDQQVTEIDAYLQTLALPDYEKFRGTLFVILANPPKPIYSAPVNATQH